MALFTSEELEELRRADEELDADFRQTQEEIEESRKRDRRVSFERKDNRGRKIAAQKAAYREANRGEYNAYMREYMRQYRAKKKAASGGQTGKRQTQIGSGLV